jgi:anti-anti-sigma factor
MSGVLPPIFSVSVRQPSSGGLVVVARGELDLATRERFRQALTDARACGVLAEVDLTEVTFMDVTAVQVLLDIHDQAGDAEGLPVVRVGRVADRLIRLVGVADRLAVRRVTRGTSEDHA